MIAMALFDPMAYLDRPGRTYPQLTEAQVQAWRSQNPLIRCQQWQGASSMKPDVCEKRIALAKKSQELGGYLAWRCLECPRNPQATGRKVWRPVRPCRKCGQPIDRTDVLHPQICSACEAKRKDDLARRGAGKS